MCSVSLYLFWNCLLHEIVEYFLSRVVKVRVKVITSFRCRFSWVAHG